jgi:hypothetical protein
MEKLVPAELKWFFDTMDAMMPNAIPTFKQYDNFALQLALTGKVSEAAPTAREEYEAELLDPRLCR